jgi:hypothetical protein
MGCELASGCTSSFWGVARPSGLTGSAPLLPIASRGFSRQQVCETLTAFWHDHFNVLASGDRRAGAANEIYARELMELHTLGRGAYLNDRYDRWREVPGALEGKPIGYIDEDVYEAARAFTGWSIENGQKLDSQTGMSRTDRFRYVENRKPPRQAPASKATKTSLFKTSSSSNRGRFCSGGNAGCCPRGRR